MALPRWGLVGAGGMARVIARTLARLSYPVSGVHSRTFERAQALAEEFGLGRPTAAMRRCWIRARWISSISPPPTRRI